MFVALRRFTIPLTIILQYYILKTRTSTRAMFAIFLLVFGSLIAVLQDFQFNLLGYFLCLVNDVGDSCEAIFTKRQLNLKNQHDDSNRYRRLSDNCIHDEDNEKKYDENQNLEEYYKEDVKQEANYNDVNVGKVAIIYYCALLNLIPLSFVVYLTGDLENFSKFDYWDDSLFILMFISCSFFSLVFLLVILKFKLIY